MSKEKKCSYCGTVHEEQEMVAIGNGYFCPDCVIICSDCGESYLRNEVNVVRINRNELDYVCNDCINSDRYFKCRDCNEYFVMDFLWETYRGEHICQFCSDDYRICDNCEEVFHYCDITYFDERNEYLCDECIEEISPNVQDLLHDYYYKPFPQFLKEENFHPEINDECYLGIELEVDNEKNPDPKGSRIAAQTIINNFREKAYLKHDGSLSNACGFEILSHPATLNYHLNYFGWDEITRICKENNLLSNNSANCGLHIHISRKFFGKTQEEQDLNIAKLILLFSRFYKSHIIPFSRRKEEELRWCYNNELVYEQYDDEKSIVDKMKKSTRNRYQSINVEPEDTVEFRIYKGSLICSTLFACMQFTVLISKFAKEINLKDIPSVQWKDIFISNEYPELKQYLKRKELI